MNLGFLLDFKAKVSDHVEAAIAEFKASKHAKSS